MIPWVVCSVGRRAAGRAQRTQGGGRHIRLADHHLEVFCAIAQMCICATYGSFSSTACNFVLKQIMLCAIQDCLACDQQLFAEQNNIHLMCNSFFSSSIKVQIVKCCQVSVHQIVHCATASQGCNRGLMQTSVEYVYTTLQQHHRGSAIHERIARIKGPPPNLPRVSYSDQYGSTECKAEAWICKKFSWWMISCISRLSNPVVHKSILFEFLAYIDNLISLLCLCKTICIPLLGRVLV